MIIQFLVSLAATLSFAVLFSAEKKQLFFCGLTGALGWIVYLICLQNHTDNAIANLIATFALTLVARILSANSGHGVPAHRDLPTCSGCRNLLYLLLLYHGRYEPVLTVRNQYCESCRFDRAWHYLWFCASTEPL